MSQPGEPDRLAGGGEPARPAQPAGDRQRGHRPYPVQPGGQRLRPGQAPGRVQRLVPHHVQPGLQRIDHLQGGGDLQLPGRGQVGGCCGPQLGHALFGARRALAQRRGALVEQDRVDPLRPGGAPAAQVVVQLRAGVRKQDG
jgi:hypothetical protein